MAKPGDLFPTNPFYANAVAQRLKDYGWLDGHYHIWEPCAGDGAIVRQLLHVGADPRWISATELVEDQRATKLSATGVADIEYGDCHEHVGGPYSIIVTNPPFTMGVEIFELAQQYLNPVGWSIIILMNQLHWLATQERQPFWRANPCRLLVMGARVSFNNAGSDRAEYGWFYWVFKDRVLQSMPNDICSSGPASYGLSDIPIDTMFIPGDRGPDSRKARLARGEIPE